MWLPYECQGREHGLKPHQYCTECGLIKSIASEHIHSIGYFTNVLASLAKDYKIAKVQMRLISQEMEKYSLDDSYGIDRHQQEKIFVEIIKRYLNIPERAVIDLLSR